MQIKCVLFTRPIMVIYSSLHLMKLKYCLSMMIQNKMKHYRLLQNKLVIWMIQVDTFTEFFTHLSPALWAAGFSHLTLQKA